MRKTLAILLCVITVISFCSVSTFAAEEENVALGNTNYTINGLYSDDSGTYYPDETGDSLTNGVFAVSASYTDAEFVGLNITSEYAIEHDGATSISIDLGEVFPITSAVLSCSNLGNAGILLPSGVVVTVSADGETWSDPFYAECETDSVVSGEVYKLAAKINQEARYVTYTVFHASNWVFVDELMVYAGDISTEESKEESAENETEESQQQPTVSVPEEAENDKEPADITWVYVTVAAVSVLILVAVIIFRFKK